MVAPLLLGAAVGSKLLSGFFGGKSAKKAARQQLLARREGVANAKEENAELYAKNNASFDRYAPEAREAMRSGYETSRATLAPLRQMGDNAFADYETLSGLRGEGARSARVSELHARPEFRAAIYDTVSSNASRFGAAGKSNSGAAMRALHDRQLGQMTGYVNQERQALQPLMQIGANATSQQAGRDYQYGGDRRSQAWQEFGAKGSMDNLYHGNNAAADMALAGANANYAGERGQINANMWTGIGNTIGNAFMWAGSGGAGGGAMPSAGSWAANTNVFGANGANIANPTWNIS